jgi:hypothetical protein
MSKAIFLELNVSIITNLYLQFYGNPVEFLKRGDNELLANIIELLRQYRREHN